MSVVFEKAGAEEEEFSSKNCTAATRNACQLCTPLGACLVFRGIEGTIPFLHGSQGCSTYIRRYLISHFREPIDIASSNFSESSAVFGGKEIFKVGVQNVYRQYNPKMIGVATTCLSETIGEDMNLLFHEYISQHWEEGHPHMVHVSTPSFKGSHIDGFHAAVRAVTEGLALPGAKSRRVNIFPGMLSAADLRHLKEIIADFGLPFTMLPDYSESMDGETWSEYEKLQSGGTPIEDIEIMGSGQVSVEFGHTIKDEQSAALHLEKRFSIPRRSLGLPIGVKETDAFFELLETVSGHTTPLAHQKERGRLVDSFIDGHKYVFEKKAVVYGEEDLVIGLASFLTEIGIIPVLCATGGSSGNFKRCLKEAVPALDDRTIIRDKVDFAEIGEMAESLKPDFFIGNSKGYSIARRLGVPIVRIGFPIHDRIGGQRVLHVGYRGAQQLFDMIVNTLLEVKQEKSEVGYSYL